MRVKGLNPGQTHDVGKDHNHLVTVQLQFVWLDVDPFPKICDFLFDDQRNFTENDKFLEWSLRFSDTVSELAQGLNCFGIGWNLSVHSLSNLLKCDSAFNILFRFLDKQCPCFAVMRRVNWTDIVAAAPNIAAAHLLLLCVRCIENFFDVTCVVQSEVRIHTNMNRLQANVATDVAPVTLFDICCLLPTKLQHTICEALIGENDTCESLNKVFLHLLQKTPLNHGAVETDAGAIQNVHKLLYL